MAMHDENEGLGQGIYGVGGDKGDKGDSGDKGGEGEGGANIGEGEGEDEENDEQSDSARKGTGGTGGMNGIWDVTGSKGESSATQYTFFVLACLVIVGMAIGLIRYVCMYLLCTHVVHVIQRTDGRSGGSEEGMLMTSITEYTTSHGTEIILDAA